MVTSKDRVLPVPVGDSSRAFRPEGFGGGTRDGSAKEGKPLEDGSEPDGKPFRARSRDVTKFT